MAFTGKNASFAGVVTPPQKTTIAGANTSIDLSTSQTHHIEADLTTILAFTNPVDGAKYIFIVEQTVGSKTITWPAGFVWKGGSAPTLSTALNKVDIIAFVYLAHTTSYYADASLDF